jgi:hypothetical protein
MKIFPRNTSFIIADWSFQDSWIEFSISEPKVNQKMAAKNNFMHNIGHGGIAL